MAEILKEFVFSSPTDRRRVFPWKEWSDGKIRVLTAGEDFPRKYKLEEVQTRAHIYARNHGMKARTQKMNARKIVVQFYTPAKKASPAISPATKRKTTARTKRA